MNNWYIRNPLQKTLLKYSLLSSHNNETCSQEVYKWCIVFPTVIRNINDVSQHNLYNIITVPLIKASPLWDYWCRYVVGLSENLHSICQVLQWKSTKPDEDLLAPNHQNVNEIHKICTCSIMQDCNEWNRMNKHCQASAKQ